jgi:ABC-2 type transport system ATP-binding protein
MSIVVNGLTKLFGEQKAIDNVSFEAKKGEVLGFLGPNGAGKTTTMKILTCFIPQSEGNATVCGFDVETNPLDVKRHIGYLPEHNPLYKDMYVKEYLDIVAGIYKIENKKKRIADLIEMTGLGVEQNKQIGQLSKGYRQRVGIAQAIIHDPEVLIFDEPTSGLDPNQLVEIRNLIKNLGKEKTVIFSTHIMQEVKAICDRVLIINKGKIVADENIANIGNLVKSKQVVVVELANPISKQILQKINGIGEIKDLGTNRWELTSLKTEDFRMVISNFAQENGITILEMKKDTVSVEDVFQQLTQN